MSEEDQQFIYHFTIESGSLKALAKLYDVTYPTLRVRLDRLINKIKLVHEGEDEPYILSIKALAIDNQISYRSAKNLIDTYRKYHPK